MTITFVTGGAYRCEGCSRTFTTERGLSVHRHYCGALECPLCGRPDTPSGCESHFL